MVTSLLLVASLVLPSVLGRCCVPDYQAGMFDTDDPTNFMKITQIFSKRKYVITPIDQSKSPIEFKLVDYATYQMYVRYTNGTCHTLPLPIEGALIYDPCLYRFYRKTGNYFMGKDEELIAYELDAEIANVRIFVTKEDCLPMMNMVKAYNSEQRKTYVVLNPHKVESYQEKVEVEKDVSSCVDPNAKVDEKTIVG